MGLPSYRSRYDENNWPIAVATPSVAQESTMGDVGKRESGDMR